MARALSSLRHPLRACGVEQHHGFGGERAPFGGAEGKRIDARLPRRLGERSIHAGKRVCEPRPIDMHEEPARVGQLGNRGNLVHGVARSGFGRLRERDDAGAYMVRPAPLAVERTRKRCRRELAPLAGKADELETAAEEFRRPAFVGRDMRLLMADDRAPRGREMRKRKRIGRSPRPHQEHRHLAFEHFGETALDPLRPGIVAISEHRAFVGARKRRQNFRRDGSRVVAGKIHVAGKNSRD